jgi:uracil-DNA glycosylase family protein
MIPFGTTHELCETDAAIGLARRLHPPLEMPSAVDFLPPRLNLTSLARATEICRGCELYKHATQAVFGSGARRASLMLVGEMPGDEEDRAGLPFVGPAGRLLDATFEQAGINREDLYLTNVVKHFRWEPRGKRRLHKKPATRQIEACKPWLHAEIRVVKPRVIMCLGATAAHAMLGHDFRLTKDRGKFFRGEQTDWLIATYHPSAILRAPNKERRDEMRAALFHDLRSAAERALTPARTR